MKNKNTRKGFTLIELLVVIAIIAILSVVVILTLNPAELLRQSRDSNRVSDFATLKSSISLFLADVTTSTTNALGTTTILYASSATSPAATSTYIGSGAAAWGYTTTSVTTLSTSTSRAINGTGWIPINFSAISSGAPIGNEPVDPVNNATNFYTYAGASTVFKLAGKIESAKYGFGGANDVVSTDGGNSTSTYEQGTNLNL